MTQAKNRYRKFAKKMAAALAVFLHARFVAYGFAKLTHTQLEEKIQKVKDLAIEII